jgi:cystathionine beta-lyase/cystathionine gamma-synthase
LFSFDIQLVLRLNLVLLLFLFLDTVHDTGLPVIKIDLLSVQVGLVLLLMVENTLVNVSLFSSLLYGDALFVVSHILAESLGLKSDFMLGLVLVEFSLAGRIFKAHLHFFLCQEIVRGD